MSTTAALHTSASLKDAGAPAYSSMAGKLDPQLLEALKEMKFDFMTPVQEQVLGQMSSLRSDCLVQAKTGTGKTTAFLLPAIQGLLQNSPRKGQVAILILSPTRELALQISAEAARLVSKLNRPLEVHTAFGGTAKASNLAKFKNGDPKILVATPGRLNDYLSEMDVRGKFEGLRTLVLDEADRMLDQGFLPDILKVLHALPPKDGPNGQWQGMCFSATIPPKMQQVFSHILRKDHIAISTIDAAEPPTLAKVPQFSVIVPHVEQTFSALFSLLKEEIKASEGAPKIVVFGTTAHLVAIFAKIFKNQLDLPVWELHSRLSQPARTRTTEEFKVAKRALCLLLTSSDEAWISGKYWSHIVDASRDIGLGTFRNSTSSQYDVSLVLQVGLPTDSDAYTHRVGRTARAGKDGRAIILLTQAESFWLNTNRQFPIKPYPASDAINNDSHSATHLATVLQTIDPESKSKAYRAYLGFMKVYMNKMRLTPSELVQMANTLATEGMLCDGPPPLEKRVIGKMGLQKAHGLVIAAPSQSHSHSNNRNYTDKPRSSPQKRDASSFGTTTNEHAPLPRRFRHQGIPGAAEGNGFGGFGGANEGGYGDPRDSKKPKRGMGRGGRAGGGGRLRGGGREGGGAW